MSAEEWIEQASRTLGPTKPTGDGHSRPAVVLVGAYNAAKTSLLRRLLADHEQPIPDWARVSAREETSQVGRVEVGGCTIVDTPGLEALSQWHGDDSRDALLEADAVALVTTSNLLATGPSRRKDGEDHLRPVDVLTGRMFAADGQPYPPGALAVFITRFDEAGPDPTDFPDQFADFRDRKLAELRALLQEHLPEGAAIPTVAAISPDPFGRKRNSDPDRAAYDRYREWDGMQAVEHWLSDVQQRAEELAVWRRVRRLTFALTDAQRQVAEALQVAQQAVASITSDLAQAEHRAARCLREQAAAEARLRAAIDTAVHAAPAPTEGSFSTELRRLLVRELTHWGQATAATLAELVEDTQAGLSVRAAPAAGAERAADELMRHLSAGSTGWQEAATRLQSGIRIVKSGLNAVTVSDADQPSVADPGGPKLPGLSPERVAQLGLLLTLAEAVLTSAEEEGVLQRAPEREAHRAQLLDQAEAVSHSMFASEEAPAGWRGMFAALQAASDEAARELAQARDKASRQVEVDEQRSQEIRELLAGRPAPPAA